MTLYSINAALEELLNQQDPETGELTCDLDQLDTLMMERDEKLEGLALYVKNADAEAKAIREEEKALAERRRSLENKAERAKGFLAEQLAGEKFSTPKVAISYRKSEAVDLTARFWNTASNGRFMKYTPEANRTAIKEALKNGEMIPGAEIVTKQNMQIK